jgi:hypothetical protein
MRKEGGKERTKEKKRKGENNLPQSHVIFTLIQYESKGELLKVQFHVLHGVAYVGTLCFAYDKRVYQNCILAGAFCKRNTCGAYIRGR